MKSSNILIAHPTSSDQIEALIAVVKALKIKFEVKTSDDNPYDSEFVAKVEESRAQYKKGEYKAIKIDDLWK